MRGQSGLRCTGADRGLPTWITPLRKGHNVDPVQIIFLWEKRIKVTLLGREVPRTDSETGMEMGGGGGGWTQGHRRAEQGMHSGQEY